MARFTVYDFVVADRDMVARGKSYSFRSYTDRIGYFGNPGSEVIYNDGTRSATGKPIGKPFSVNQSHYKLQAREDQTDNDKKKMLDFFKYAPFCYGSPNGDYIDQDGHQVPLEELTKIENNIKRLKTGEMHQINVKIKLMDDESDAKVALETGLKRAEAQISTGQIDEATLTEIAALIGVFNKPEKSMRLAVYEYAGKRPLDYFKLLEAGDRPIRSAIRLALDKGILTQKGSVIYWKETVMGGDEDAVVTTLMADKAMLDSLKSAVKEKVDKKPTKKK